MIISTSRTFCKTYILVLVREKLSIVIIIFAVGYLDHVVGQKSDFMDDIDDTKGPRDISAMSLSIHTESDHDAGYGVGAAEPWSDDFVLAAGHGGRLLFNVICEMNPCTLMVEAATLVL
jgi:hypothetical protein